MARIDDYAPDLWQPPAGDAGDNNALPPPPPPSDREETAEEAAPLAHPKIIEALKDIEECFLTPGGSLSIFCAKFQDQETIYLHEDLATWEEENPYDTSKQLELGYHYLYVMQDYPKAVLAYHSALKVFDLDPEMHSNLGQAYFGMGEYKKACDVYGAALELDPRNSQIRALRAEAGEKYAASLDPEKEAEEIARVKGEIAADKALVKASEVEVGITEEQEKASVLIELGKLDEAHGVLKGIKSDLIAPLSKEEKEALKSSPRYETLRARSRLLRAQITDREGDPAKAVEINEGVLPDLDKVLEDDPANREALRLRAQVHHRLLNYGKALEDLSACSDQEADDYRSRLKSLFEKIGAGRHLANAQEEPVREMSCLTEQLKIAEALSWKDEAADLTLQIQQKSDDAALEKMTRDAEDMAEKGYIPADQMKMLEEEGYANLSVPEKVAVLQELQRVGLVGQNKAALEKETDPTKKLVFEYKIALLEGRLAEGELKARDFKDQVKTKLEEDPKLLENDPELEVAYEEARGALQKLTLQHIDELTAQSEMIGEQRHRHFGGYFGTFRPQDHAQFLKVLAVYVKKGQADTLEEAAAAMEADYPRRFEKFWRKTAIGQGENATFRMPETTAEQREKAETARIDLMTALMHKTEDASLFDPEAYPDLYFARLEGGTLSLAKSYNTELDTKPIRVVVGREGGFIQFNGAMGGQVYYFPPSEREKVVLVERNELVAVNLDEGDFYHDPTNARKWDYASVYPIRNPFITPPNFMGTGIDHKKKGLRYLETAIPHLQRLREGYKDPLLTALFHRYTREGLENEATPEGRRAETLRFAKLLSERDGSFALAETSLKEVMAKEYNEALEAAEAEGAREEVTKEIEDDRNDIEERVRKQFQAQANKLKIDVTEDKIQAAVQAAVDGEIAAKMDLKAYAILDRWADEGKIEDPISLEAWNELESQKDPTGEVFRVSREGWADTCNFIENEAVMFAMTAPLTMGAGSLVRGAIGGTAFVTRLVAQGGWRALAARSAVFLAGATAEGVVMTGLGGAFGSEFAAQGVGFNIVMSCVFHGAGKGWGKVASKLGIDDEAIRLAEAAGESTLRKKIGNFAGTMATQTKVGVGWTYVHEVLSDQEDPRVFWERLGQEGFRMGAGHFGNKAINVALDYAPMRYEMLASGRHQLAQKAFKTLYALHLADLDAHGVSGKESSNIARQKAANEAAAYAKGLKAGTGEGEPVLVFDQEAAVKELEAEQTRAKKPSPHEELGIADTQPVPLVRPAGAEVPPVLSELTSKIHRLKQFTARYRGEPLVDHIAKRVALCEAALGELHAKTDLYEPNALTDSNVQAELLAVGEMLERGFREMEEVKRVVPLRENNADTLRSPLPRTTDDENTQPLAADSAPDSGLEAWKQLPPSPITPREEAITQERFNREVVDSWSRRDAQKQSARSRRASSGDTGVTRVPSRRQAAAPEPPAILMTPAEAVAHGYRQAWENGNYWSGIRGNFPILLRATGKILKITMQTQLLPPSGIFEVLALTAGKNASHPEIQKRAALMARALERVYDYYPEGDAQKAFIEAEVVSLTRDMTQDSSEASLPVYWSRMSDVFAHLIIEHAGREPGVHPRNPVLDFQLEVGGEHAIIPGAQAPKAGYRTQRY